MKTNCYTDRNGIVFIPNDYVRIWTTFDAEYNGTIRDIRDGVVFLTGITDGGRAIYDVNIQFEHIKDIAHASTAKPQVDMVSHPPHYQSETGLGVIDVIEAFTFDLKGIEATDTGNIIKYICRWKQKNGVEDLRKAKWYLEHLINHVELLEKENG